MKAATYAQFSSDRQRDASIDDQVRICERRADAEDLRVAKVYSDAAISGSTKIADRLHAKQMEAAALARAFDVLIVESLDRLSRDVGDQDGFIKRLEFRGIRIIGVSVKRFPARLAVATTPARVDNSRIGTLKAEIANLSDAIASGVLRTSPAIAERLQRAESELARLESKAAEPVAKVARMLPRIADQ